MGLHCQDFLILSFLDSPGTVCKNLFLNYEEGPLAFTRELHLPGALSYLFLGN